MIMMASTGSHWEVVGKPNKTKTQNSTAPQQRKKGSSENASKIAPTAPSERSSTIYDAFLEKERKAQAKLSAEHGKGDAVLHSPKKTNAPKKKTEKKKDQLSTLSLEGAVAKIDMAELEAVLSKDQATFPDNPSVWLLDLASLLNLRLECVPEDDHALEEKPSDYPVGLLPKKIRSLMLNTIQHCSSPTLVAFTEHCMQSMIGDMSKGMPTHGYRMFIQLLAQHKPDVILQNLAKYLEMVQTNKNRPLRCLAIMWAVGQVGVKDLSKGLKVWLEVMLPVLNCRSLSSFGVGYLDNLFKIHNTQKTANGVIGFKNFFPIMDYIFTKQSPLPSQLQKRLLALYPRIKAISFGPHPESSLRNFFPSFLARLNPHCPSELKSEVLASLVTCLAQDPVCYSVWRQMYTKHLINSSELLTHLAKKWPASGLDQKQLKETVTAFNVTNAELSTQGKKNVDGLDRCITSCKDLLTKMSRGRFPWRWLFFILLLVCAGLVSFDIYSSKGAYKSRSYHWLKSSGTLAFLKHLGQRIQLYSANTLTWLEVNVPYYWGRTCEFLGPYFVLFWNKLYELGVWFLAVTEPQRRWVQRKVPEVLEYAQKQWPSLWSSIVYYAEISWKFVLYYSLIVWNFVVHYFNIVGLWLQENVFTGSMSIENLQKTAVSMLVALQHYLSVFLQWCASLVTSDSA